MNNMDVFKLLLLQSIALTLVYCTSYKSKWVRSENHCSFKDAISVNTQCYDVFIIMLLDLKEKQALMCVKNMSVEMKVWLREKKLKSGVNDQKKVSLFINFIKNDKFIYDNPG